MDSSESRVTWGPLAAILVTVGSFFAAQFIMIALFVGGFIAVSSIFGDGGPTTNNPELDGTISVFLMSFLSAATLFGLIYVFIRKKGSSLRAIGFKRPHWIDTAWAVAGYVAYFAAFLVISSIIKSQAPELFDQNQDIGFSTTSEGLSLLPIIISLVIFPPIVEETLFRGFLYGGLRTKFSVGGSIIVTSLLFAAAHLLGGETSALLWIAFIDTFILSVVLCGLREKTGSIWPSIFLHGLKNGVAFLALFILRVS